MASNRNWPSMFKRSKPSNPHHNNTNSSLMSTGFQRTTPYTAVGDERNPEPKPRWNPKPEQIRILEGIFDSGMMNPPREEIRKICTQLQEYGKVGDANVFYWFQNRKSRTKHKVGRQLHKNKSHQNSPSPTALLPQITPPSSSSSSSDKSSPQQLINPPHNNYNDFSNINGDQLLPMLNSSPTPSVNQTYFQTHMNETTFQLPPPASESFPLIPLLQNINDQRAVAIADNANITTQGLYNLSDFSNMNQPQENVVPCNTMNLMHQDPQLDFGPSTDPVTVPPLTNQVQGVGEVAVGPFNVRGESIQVFINDELYEVAVGPFNVREAFGDGYVLFHSSGHPLLTDEWGFTLHSLQHAQSYYLI